MNQADDALIKLGRQLRADGYRATAITPLSHQRVMSRARDGGLTLQDIFSWTCPFRPGDLPARLLALLGEAGELREADGMLRSNVRFSSLDGMLFVHSAFPTTATDVVFFGPDTYRFARFIRESLKNWVPPGTPRIIDIGCGSGAGGIVAASILKDYSEVVLADINVEALRYSRINASINDIDRITLVESDVFSHIEGDADLILSNPPYLVDPQARLYRHGGGDLGNDLSMRIASDSAERLTPGGKLLLYTGAPIFAGEDILFEALSSAISSRGKSLTYNEIDPDVFGEELERAPYDRADRIAAVGAIVNG